MLVKLCVSNGIKDCLPSFPSHAQPFHQANHGFVVRDENLAFLECQREMAVADFEGDLHCFVVVRWKNCEDRFDGSFDFQIPIRSDVQDRSMRESRARGECDTDLASPFCCES